MAGRWSRFISTVNQGIRNIGRVFGSEAPPSYTPGPTTPEEIIDYGPPVNLEDVESIEVEETIEEVEVEESWFGDEITVWNQYGEPFSHTKEEWHAVLLLSKEDMLAEYGMDNLDIIRAIAKIEPRVWTKEDWERWRAEYDLAHAFPPHTRRNVA